MTTSGRQLLVDEPVPHVQRLTRNRPEKRNALDNTLRGAIFEALRAADVDAAVRVSVIRGAGHCFSAGYDLSADLTADRPYPTTGGEHRAMEIKKNLGRVLEERDAPFGDYRGRQGSSA